ncbi:hypothetical protein CK203_005334 [Vitis vinifera]|uniref:Uncharacterized protein n=1 Tax=Vitis vinifera TaxID=29760 RepID=A0A438F1S1_VITVI|nr:hypothetical protein CK203_072928 [Vitis vinifera]RVX19612.1 hypothetical protein CK203_005334 [Vitis vinifera]
MSGKGAKGLIMGKSPALNKDKDKKKPVSRSSRAGLQGGFCDRGSVWLLGKGEGKKKEGKEIAVLSVRGLAG